MQSCDLVVEGIIFYEFLLQFSNTYHKLLRSFWLLKGITSSILQENCYFEMYHVILD